MVYVTNKTTTTDIKKSRPGPTPKLGGHSTCSLSFGRTWPAMKPFMAITHLANNKHAGVLENFVSKWKCSYTLNMLKSYPMIGVCMYVGKTPRIVDFLPVFLIHQLIRS
jgi:hypothetical protein